jgi:hypothetical protein
VIKDLVRTTLHRAITTPTGDGFAPVRVPKDLARRLNVTFGQPLCSTEQLAARRAAEARLVGLRSRKGPAPATETARTAAPVMVYFEKDRNARELGRVEELLKAKSVPYQLLDVASDEATLMFVTRAADCESDDLPIVFVAGAPVGDFRALVAADVSGELMKAIYG